MTPSVFVRTPGANRAIRAACCVLGVTTITGCTRVDAASAPQRTLLAASAPTATSFEAPLGTYDAVMAQRGKVHFNQYCAQCHVKPRRGAARPTKTYVRLRHLGSDTAFFADGSARTLEEVVGHYDGTLQMHLSKAQQSDLVEYLKSH